MTDIVITPARSLDAGAVGNILSVSNDGLNWTAPYPIDDDPEAIPDDEPVSSRTRSPSSLLLSDEKLSLKLRR